MDRRIYYLSIFIFIAMIPSLLHAQKTALNDSLKIEKIINKLQNKNLKGQVITVNNPADVAFISSFINKTGNQPLQREKTYIINDSKTVGGRYKQGDKKTIPEVMKILNSSDNDAIDELLTQMAQEFDDTLRPYKLEDEIKNKLFELADVPELESSIILFLNKQNIEGRNQFFEKRLLSGKSSQPNELISALSEEKQVSDKVVDFFCKQLKEEKPTISITNNLDNIYDKSSTVAKKQLKDVLYSYLDKNPLSLKDFSSAETFDQVADTTSTEGDSISTFTGYDEDKLYKKQVLYKVIGDYDIRNLALIDKIKALISDKEILQEQKEVLEHFLNIAGFPFLDIKKRKQIVLDNLKGKETYDFSLYDIHNDEELKRDPELQAAVLINGEELGFYQNEHRITDIKPFFSYLDSKSFNDLIQKNIKSSEIKNAIFIENYLLDKKFKWLADNGFKTKMLTPQQKSDFLKDIRDDKKSSIFTAMAINDIGVNLEPENVKQVENYNVLIEKFIKSSDGKIKDVKSCVQFVYDDYFKKFGPRVFVSYKGKCYILIPEQYSEFSEIGLIRLVLDDVVKEAAIKEKYYFLDAYDIQGTYGEYCVFGDSNAIQKIIDKYGVSESRNPQDDYK